MLILDHLANQSYLHAPNLAAIEDKLIPQINSCLNISTVNEKPKHAGETPRLIKSILSVMILFHRRESPCAYVQLY